jgi:glycine/D-amino acid oxidase-like deaminating enzyme
MLKGADVVVIGSGGLGAATAFYLAKRMQEPSLWSIGTRSDPRPRRVRLAW